MKVGLGLSLALGCAGFAVDASASPLLDLTGGTDGLGGLQAGTIGGGASAAYFNPALLTQVPFGFTIGFMAISEQIGISLDGRPGTQFAVPEGVANATHANGSSLGNIPIPTNLLQNGRAANGLNNPAQAARPRQGAGTGHETTAYEMIGFVAKLFDDRLALGFYGIIPDGNFTNLDAFYPDEREQYFSNSLHPELYGDRLSPVSIAFGAGFKVAPNFSIGLGASLSLQAGVGAPTYVANAGALQDLLIDTNAKVNVSLSPNVGLSYDPTSRFHLTGTIHAPEKVELGVDFTFLLPNGLQQGSDFTLVYDYMPWQFGAGASYDIVQNPDDTLTLAGTAVYGTWSQYVDRHGDAPIPAYGWYDTLTPTGGVRYRHHAAGAFLDVQYKPTPGPAPDGPQRLRRQRPPRRRRGGRLLVHVHAHGDARRRAGAGVLAHPAAPDQAADARGARRTEPLSRPRRRRAARRQPGRGRAPRGERRAADEQPRMARLRESGRHRGRRRLPDGDAVRLRRGAIALVGLGACRFGGPSADPYAYVSFPEEGGAVDASIAADDGGFVAPDDATIGRPGNDGNDRTMALERRRERRRRVVRQHDRGRLLRRGGGGLQPRAQHGLQPSAAVRRRRVADDHPDGAMRVQRRGARHGAMLGLGRQRELRAPVHVPRRQLPRALLLRRRLPGGPVLLGHVRPARLHSLPALPVMAPRRKHASRSAARELTPSRRAARPSRTPTVDVAIPSS